MAFDEVRKPKLSIHFLLDDVVMVIRGSRRVGFRGNFQALWAVRFLVVVPF